MSWCKPNKNGSVHSEEQLKGDKRNKEALSSRLIQQYHFPDFPTGIGGWICACACTEVQPTKMVTLGLAPWSTSKSSEEVGSRGGSHVV